MKSALYPQCLLWVLLCGLLLHLVKGNGPGEDVERFLSVTEVRNASGPAVEGFIEEDDSKVVHGGNPNITQTDTPDDKQSTTTRPSESSPLPKYQYKKNRTSEAELSNSVPKQEGSENLVKKGASQVVMPSPELKNTILARGRSLADPFSESQKARSSVEPSSERPRALSPELPKYKRKKLTNQKVSSSTEMSLPATSAAWALASLRTTPKEKLVPLLGDVKPFVQWSTILNKAPTTEIVPQYGSSTQSVKVSDIEEMINSTQISSLTQDVDTSKETLQTSSKELNNVTAEIIGATEKDLHPSSSLNLITGLPEKEIEEHKNITVKTISDEVETAKEKPIRTYNLSPTPSEESDTIDKISTEFDNTINRSDLISETTTRSSVLTTENHFTAEPPSLINNSVNEVPDDATVSEAVGQDHVASSQPTSPSQTPPVSTTAQSTVDTFKSTSLNSKGPSSVISKDITTPLPLLNGTKPLTTSESTASVENSTISLVNSVNTDLINVTSTTPTSIFTLIEGSEYSNLTTSNENLNISNSTENIPVTQKLEPEILSTSESTMILNITNTNNTFETVPTNSSLFEATLHNIIVSTSTVQPKEYNEVLPISEIFKEVSTEKTTKNSEIFKEISTEKSVKNLDIIKEVSTEKTTNNSEVFKDVSTETITKSYELFKEISTEKTTKFSTFPDDAIIENVTFHNDASTTKSYDINIIEPTDVSPKPFINESEFDSNAKNITTETPYVGHHTPVFPTTVKFTGTLYTVNKTVHITTKGPTKVDEPDTEDDFLGLNDTSIFARGEEGDRDTDETIDDSLLGHHEVLFNNSTKSDVTTGTSTPTTTQTANIAPLETTTVREETDHLNEGHSKPAEDDFMYDNMIPTFTRLLIQANDKELCAKKEDLRTSILKLFNNENRRDVSRKQIVIHNLGPKDCLARNPPRENGLTPIQVYLTNIRGQYDNTLTDEFINLWQRDGLDFPYPVKGVEKVTGRGVEMASDSEGNNSIVAAIVISSIAGVCLLFITILLIIIRKRQKGFNYGQRCTPVSLEDYSLDNISVYNSVRRKAVRASKRSYGNPAFDDPGAISHVVNFATLTNFSSNRSLIDEEFTQIPVVTVKPDELPPGVENKNRFANVIPLPETRVPLNPTKQSDEKDTYINANFVKGAKGEEKFYIACQAPMVDTVSDFWQMIWQQQSRMIIMLTELQEGGVEKCADYMPPSEVLDCHRVFGDLQVTLKKREVRENYVISSLQLKNLETNLWREVIHLWYLTWPHHGVPEEPSAIIALLIEARSYIKSKENNAPIVVHCSPGTGRTGTVIAIDISIRDFEIKRTVDIPRTVYNIRKERAGAVQTKDQYAFIYQVLHLYATKLTGGGLDSI